MSASVRNCAPGVVRTLLEAGSDPRSDCTWPRYWANGTQKLVDDEEARLNRLDKEKKAAADKAAADKAAAVAAIRRCEDEEAAAHKRAVEQAAAHRRALEEAEAARRSHSATWGHAAAGARDVMSSRGQAAARFARDGVVQGGSGRCAARFARGSGAGGQGGRALGGRGGIASAGVGARGGCGG